MQFSYSLVVRVSAYRAEIRLCLWGLGDITLHSRRPNVVDRLYYSRCVNNTYQLQNMLLASQYRLVSAERLLVAVISAIA